MDKRKLIFIAIAWMAMFFVLPKIFPGMTGGKQYEPVISQKNMLLKAKDKEDAAGKSQKKLNEAVKAYQGVAKKAKNTEYAAEAKLHIAVIQETKLIQRPGWFAKVFGVAKQTNKKQELAAVQTYKAIVKDFPTDESPAAKEAKERMEKLQIKMDRENSHRTLYRIIDFLVNATGKNPKYSYFLALLIVTIVFKFLTTPLSHLQFKYMKEMQKLQPLVKELQEKYKGDQKTLGEKTMQLYKEHGVNPFSGCLPLLVQLPVLWVLYAMVRQYEYQFTNGVFLWIGSGLAHKFPGIVAPNLAQPDIVLLVIYTISMIISQKMTVMDPTQAEQQKIMAYAMPIVFAFMFMSFPAAFMLYWLLFNIISTGQQYMIMRKPAGPALPPSTGASKAAPTGKGTGGGKGGSGKSKRHGKRFDALSIDRPAQGLFPADSASG